MALTFPRDLVFEAYLGQWVDITALALERSLRQVEPVTIHRGSPNEQGNALAPPSTLACALNNTGGHWTPGNAMSDYYAYLRGRNVPARLSLRVGRDAFTGRTVVDSWGTSDSGDTYRAVIGPDSDYDVAAGVGTARIPIAGTERLRTMIGSYLDAEVRGSIVIPINNIVGGPLSAGLVLRYQPSGPQTGHFYRLVAEMSATEVLTLRIEVYDGALTTIAGPITIGFSVIDAVSPKSLRLIFQAEGQTLRGNVTFIGSPGIPNQFEPLGWQLTAHDERLQRAGEAGWYWQSHGTNTNTHPIVASHDDLDVRLPRFTGEIQKLAPTWDERHKIKKAALTAAGVSMRLNRPGTPKLRSAIERFVTGHATQPAAYWPLDDGPLVTQGRAYPPGVPFKAVVTDGNHTEVRFPFGTGQMAPWLDPCIEIKNSPFTFFAPDPQVTGWYTVHAGLSYVGGRYPTNTNTDGLFIGSGFSWTITFRSATYEIDVAGPAGPSVGTVSVPGFYDQKLHHVALRARQNGGAADWSFYIDGAQVLSGSIAATTVPAISRVSFAQNGGSEDTRSRSVGHVAIYAGDGVPVADYSNALFGRPGERALDRAIRLCAEEGVPLNYWGAPVNTPPMGPQRSAKLLELLAECAEVAQGFLFEPRSVAGLAIRPRLGIAARAAVATLDYAAGHVAPPFAPSADDRPTRNRITATRADGGFVVAEQVTGPMNTADPGTNPDAVGVVDADAKVNVQDDAQLPVVANWARALGTVPDVRYPMVAVNLAASEVASKQADTLGLTVGDRLVVQNMQAADQYRDLDQLVRGLVETYRNTRMHRVELNTAPYEKYRSGVWGDGTSRYASQGSSFDLALAAGVTGARAVTTSAGVPWTTNPASFPLDVDCEGERITISGVTGTGPNQTMTISARSVNGVSKAHPAGAAIQIWQASYYA